MGNEFVIKNGLFVLSGNVGIGLSSIEAWASQYSALQLGGTVGIYSRTATGANGYLHIGENRYTDSGGVKYLATDEASNYRQGDGTHMFQVAASGTADAAITWTTAMTIDESGDVEIGSVSGTNHPLNIASSGGSNIRLIGRDNGSVDEAAITFQHYDGSTYHGTIQGASTSLKFYGGSTLAMTIANDGDVAIGTSVPGNRLHVYDATKDIPLLVQCGDPNCRMEFKDSNTTTNPSIGTAGDNLVFYTGNEKMRIDSNGQVGIGISAIDTWDSGHAVLQLGGNASLMGNRAASGGGYFNIAQNAYYDTNNSRWEYQETGVASNFRQGDGQHLFQIAASGTIDTAISWTTAMSINNSGEVNVNNASNTWGQFNVHVNSATKSPLVASQGSSGNNVIELNSGNTDLGGDLFKVSGTGDVDAAGDINIPTGKEYQINGVDQAFDKWTASASDIYRSSGSVGIGIEPTGKLEVYTGGNAIVSAVQIGHDTFSTSRHVGIGFYFSTHSPKGAIGFEADSSTTNGLGSLYFCVDSNDDANDVSFTDVKMAITKDGNVGIGLTTPGNYHDYANNLVIYEAGHAGITIATGTSNSGAIYFADGASGDTEYRGYVIYSHSADSMSIGTAASTQMTIDSTGNVGFSIAALEAWHSAFTALQIGGNASIFANSDTGASNGLWISQNTYNDGAWKYISTDEATNYEQQSGKHLFRVAASGTADATITWTEAMMIDSAGNVGIGVTPETWVSIWSVLQIGGNASLATQTAAGVSKDFYMMNNAYYDGAMKYISTDEASQYVQSGGGHYFRVTESGTADAAITWTGAMAIDSSGKVGIGTTAPDELLHVHEGSGGAARAKFTNDTTGENVTDGFLVGINSVEQAILYNYEATDMVFGVSNSEAMRIDSAGNVGLGNSVLETWHSSYTALQIGGNSSIMAETSAGTGKTLDILQNAYYDSTNSRWEYQDTDEASRYRQANGTHIFYTAVSGTADAEITFTEAMTIDSAGDTDIHGLLDLYSNIRGRHSTYLDIYMDTTDGSDTKTCRIGGGGDVTYTRGATVELYGNEHASAPGELQLFAGNVSTGDITFHTGGSTTRLTIDSAGNVGIGNASLEAWESQFTALQIGGNFSIMATTAAGAGNDLLQLHNAYYDGDYKYISTDEATMYYSSDGQHEWRVAASGTADAAITWITAMTIDNAGNVGIGNTSLEAWRSTKTVLQLGGNASLHADTSVGAGNSIEIMQNIYFDDTTWKYQTTDQAGMYQQTNGNHYFYVSSSGTADTAVSFTTAMRITSVGAIQFGAYGAGTLSTDSSGNVTASSDINMKIGDGSLSDGLSIINGLTPRFFKWKEETGLDSDERQLGFYAQEVFEVLPEAAPNSIDDNENERWGIYDRAIIAALVKSVQELSAKVDVLEAA